MVHSKRALEGYLLIDHRNSPGLPSDLAHQVLAGTEINPHVLSGGQTYEAPTLRCAHCGVLVIVNRLRVRPRGYCSRCDHYICDNPGCQAECRPFTKLMDDLQTAALKGLTVSTTDERLPSIVLTDSPKER